MPISGPLQFLTETHTCMYTDIHTYMYKLFSVMYRCMHGSNYCLLFPLPTLSTSQLSPPSPPSLPSLSPSLPLSPPSSPSLPLPPPLYPSLPPSPSLSSPLPSFSHLLSGVCPNWLAWLCHCWDHQLPREWSRYSWCCFICLSCMFSRNNLWVDLRKGVTSRIFQSFNYKRE